MSLESIMRHFLATLYLLAIVALAADAAPAAREGLGEAGAAVEEGCTTSAVLTSSGILCGLPQEVAAPSKGEPGKRVSAFLGKGGIHLRALATTGCVLASPSKE
jgi:hypothetical protein